MNQRNDTRQTAILAAMLEAHARREQGAFLHLLRQAIEDPQLGVTGVAVGLLQMADELGAQLYGDQWPSRRAAALEALTLEHEVFGPSDADDDRDGG